MITQNLKKRMSIFSRKDDDDEDEWYQRSLVNFTLVAGNHPALLKLPRALENVVKPRLEIRQNNLTAAEARVLSLGLRLNCSVQELRMKDNRIGASGATSLSETLRVNKTLLVLDLRGNNIRGPGICMLADSMQDNMTLTDMDLRWNYTGESSDYVEAAIIDLNKFCERNLKSVEAIEVDLLDETTSKQPETQNSINASENGEENGNHSNSANGENGTDDVKETGTKIIGERRMMREIDATFRTASVSSLGLPKMEDGPAARIVVEVFRAKNLPPVMWSTGKDDEIPGMPHAYCMCSLNKEQHPSEISRKDYNPCWNFSCSFNVYNMWNVLVVKVAHTPSSVKRHRDDYVIGTVNIPIGWVVNWRGVTRGLDGLYRAFYRSVGASTGTVYQSCSCLDSNGVETSFFQTPEAAAHAYDEVAFKKDGERAQQNFSSDSSVIGLHVKEESFHLVGDDGVEVVGVQAGVISTIRVRLKMFFTGVNYMEIVLDRAFKLPKMDTGLGSCDAYCVIMFGDYKFRSKVVKNSLDPVFRQSFRVEIPANFDSGECRVQVWDWDRFDEDDHMGNAIVQISRGKLGTTELDGEHDIYFPDTMETVRNSKGENSKIRLKFLYYPAGSSEDKDSDSLCSSSTGSLANKLDPV
ncbi:hypothetical protein GUITHDRAFT_142716 [Guillardia theta CCMP2712]|uniref:C2 domain-containing protein n=1 Tax=Guillardia theta (strain CCMP2712) TaxID=905079 RepID=L1IWY5_GUITC|nr:hypothetical protein GUITHDRAFT_142716 [Guillardia theta CCMP2712]EKX40627.1 hypothetical protein GUITHDRAFT_142716 [Guillardia theta CCMP2712]|eukprot:XP_005827607.1 hypothetical protein GUITHDRAFT_142716 [Guillardia theta CCMP2712]